MPEPFTPLRATANSSAHHRTLLVPMRVVYGLAVGACVLMGIGLGLAGFVGDWLGIGYPGLGPNEVRLLQVAVMPFMLAIGLMADFRSMRLFGRGVHRLLLWTDTRKAVRQFLAISWMLGCAVGGYAIVSYIGARLPSIQATAGLNPSLQPFLMFGSPSSHGKLTEPSEAPAAFGYRKKRGMYVYDFEKPVASIADRSEFLFGGYAGTATDRSEAGALRVFVVGASVAWGAGATSPERAWFAQLERALSHKLKRPVHLIVAAEPAYVSTQERLLLDFAVLPRHPDAVIILDGYNDLAMPATYGIRPGDTYNLGALTYGDYYSPSFLKWLARHNQFARYFRHQTIARVLEANRHAVLNDPQRFHNYVTSTASVYLDNLSKMAGRCADAAVPCIFVLQPSRVVTWHRRGLDRTLNTEDRLTLAAYQEVISRRRAGQGPPMIDLAPAFSGPGADAWYSDPVHFGDAGQAQMAKALEEPVRNVLADLRPVPTGIPGSDRATLGN